MLNWSKICNIIIFVFSWCTAFTINIDVNFYSFFADKSYGEVYLRIEGNSVKYQGELQNLQARVEFLIIVKKEDKIYFAEKILVNSPVSDSAKDFVAMKRFYIPDGAYVLSVIAIDQNDLENKIELEQNILIDFAHTSGMLSDMILMTKIDKSSNQENENNKNGINIEPMAYGYSSPDTDEFYIYQEVYLSELDSNEIYFLNYSISDQYRESLKGNVLLTKYKKLTNENKQIVVLPISVKEFASGQYHIITKLQKKDKTILFTRKHNFYNSNPKADLAILENANDNENSFTHSFKREDMDYILKAHVPIIDQINLPTLQELIKAGTFKNQKLFIHDFWYKRNTHQAEDSYNKYMEVARAVDKQYYSNVGYGFQTHRGYIFLKHGKPNSVLSIDTEVDAPPYEIWYYNKIMTTNQTNVRFLFYNSSLVHNDFWLLHSTCYGERNNPSWETELYKSVPAERIGNTIDGTQVESNWNRHARRYFNEF